MRPRIIDDDTILAAWQECSQHLTNTAKRLGYDRANVRYRLNLLGVTIPPQKAGSRPPWVSDEVLLATHSRTGDVRETARQLGYNGLSSVYRRLARLLAKRPGPREIEKEAG